ncbi:MAG: sigma-70 family RNA polymerase sigma factor [Gemmatimonadota bacterium]|nr:sigma-70 family RNA polymerase sigma factor [Gemmatimonadota bacterium]
MTAPPTDLPEADFTLEALPHLDAVAGFARWLAGNGADADDLVQETFLRAHRSWQTFRPGTACRAWLFTICRNLHYSTRTREARMDPVSDADLEALAAAALHSSAKESGLGDVFDRFDLRDAVRREIEKLPPATREVVVLVDIEDWSYEDTARALEIPIGTVRSRLFRGRRVLQERLLTHARDAGLVGGNRQEKKG